MADPSATANIMENVFIAMGSASLTAFVTWWIAAKRIVIENITQERAKWRKKVRKQALLVHDAMIKGNDEVLDRHRSKFRISLNPFCGEDVDIVQCIRLPQQGSELKQAEEFAKRIALLLKHDWERAKRETKYFSLLRCKPKRTLYHEYISNGDTKTEP